MAGPTRAERKRREETAAIVALRLAETGELREDWRRFGLCLGEDPEIFHPSTGNGFRQRMHDATIVCLPCPVIRECHAFAESINARHGVWAGQVREVHVAQATSQEAIDRKRRAMREYQRKKRANLDATEGKTA